MPEEAYPDLDLETMRQRLAAFQTLVKSEGWVLLLELAHAQMGLRTAAMEEGELVTIENILDHARLKHERSGIKLFTMLPDTCIESLKQDIEDQEREEEQQALDDEPSDMKREDI